MLCAVRALGQDVLEVSSENLALLEEITLGAADRERGNLTEKRQNSPETGFPVLGS